MRTSGPIDAKIMIVGEAPGENEVMQGVPFVGFSGQELNKMLEEVGIYRTHCFLTNVCNERPPKNEMDQWLSSLKNEPDPERNKKITNTKWVRWRDKWAHPAVVEGYQRLLQDIDRVKPQMVIALGNTALYALTGKWGIKKWRGSQLLGKVGEHVFKVIPTYHPAAVMRDWSLRAITVHDLRRAERESHTTDYLVPSYDRIIRPNFTQVWKWIGEMQLRLNAGPVVVSCDIETKAGFISCTGFYTPGMPSLCIPWMCIERPEGYWTETEEFYLWRAVGEMMTHPNFKAVGQNWGYDAQYKWRFFFKKILPFFDTMTAHHCMLPGTPKGLDMLASMHCKYYVYWKDDGKNLDPHSLEDETRGWNYNCEDCERTYEVFESQFKIIRADERLFKVWDFQTNRLTKLLFKAMIRGVRADVEAKKTLSREFDERIKREEAWVQSVVGHELNFNSPKQLREFFYDDLQIPPRKHRTGEITTDEDALMDIGKKVPWIRRVTNSLLIQRKLGKFKSTVADMQLDRDQRIRCFYDITGTNTYRLSSKTNAFGSGGNLQNLSSGSEEEEGVLVQMPNSKKLMLPDPGHEIADCDLKSADVYTVAWESNDESLKWALEHNVDIHLMNVGSLFEVKEITQERLLDPDFVKYAKKKYEKQRNAFAKPWCHGTNFGGHDRTMAATVGITVRENEKFRLKWFHEHPGIRDWHKRTDHQIKTRRYVENRFGYRYYFFDRIDGALPEALAWVPQSTTGCVINRIWDRIDTELPEAEVLLQVHDSLTFQFLVPNRDLVLTRLEEVGKIVVPYDEPMIIPIGVKTSPISWGHC